MSLVRIVIRIIVSDLIRKKLSSGTRCNLHPVGDPRIGGTRFGPRSGRGPHRVALTPGSRVRGEHCKSPRPFDLGGPFETSFGRGPHRVENGAP